MLNTNLHLKILYLELKFRQFGPKIKISSDLLENMYTNQFENVEYESDMDNLSRYYTIYFIEIN